MKVGVWGGCGVYIDKVDILCNEYSGCVGVWVEVYVL